jgi:hypothetical protein
MVDSNGPAAKRPMIVFLCLTKRVTSSSLRRHTIYRSTHPFLRKSNRLGVQASRSGCRERVLLSRPNCRPASTKVGVLGLTQWAVPCRFGTLCEMFHIRARAFFRLYGFIVYAKGGDCSTSCFEGQEGSTCPTQLVRSLCRGGISR